MLASAASKLGVWTCLVVQSPDPDRYYVLYNSASGALVAHILVTAAMHFYNDVVTSTETFIKVPDVQQSVYAEDAIVTSFNAVRCMTAVPLRYRHNNVGLMCAIAGEANVNISHDTMSSVTQTVTNRLEDPGVPMLERHLSSTQRMTTR